MEYRDPFILSQTFEKKADQLLDQVLEKTRGPANRVFHLFWIHRIFKKRLETHQLIEIFKEVFDESLEFQFSDYFSPVRSASQQSPLFVCTDHLFDSISNPKISLLIELVKLQQLLLVIIEKIDFLPTEFEQKTGFGEQLELDLRAIEKEIENYSSFRTNLTCLVQTWNDSEFENGSHDCKIKKNNLGNQIFQKNKKKPLFEFGIGAVFSELTFRKPNLELSDNSFKYIAFEDFEKKRVEYSGTHSKKMESFDSQNLLKMYTEIDYTLNTEDEYNLLEADDCSEEMTDQENEEDDEIQSDDQNFLVDDFCASDTEEDVNILRKKNQLKTFDFTKKLLIVNFASAEKEFSIFRAIELENKYKSIPEMSDFNSQHQKVS